MNYKKWVVATVIKVSEIFSLDDWRIAVSFVPGQPDGNADTVCSVVTDSDYFKAIIYVYPYAEEIWDEGQLYILAECIVHELVHVVCDPVFKFALDAASKNTLPFLTTKNEQMTQKLTRIVMGLLPKKTFLP
jgi:hypothetical protein